MSAAIANIAYQALRTEAWMIERAQRSLYPLAWSTAHFVLDTLSGDVKGNVVSPDPSNHPNVFVNGNSLYSKDISFDVTLDNGSSVYIVLSIDSKNNKTTVTKSNDNPIRVTVTATAKDASGAASGGANVVAGRLFLADSGSGISVDWR